MNASITLDHCWICGLTEGLQEHHVVPRTYGGAEGPTVTLCTKHHALVHSVSQADNEHLADARLKCYICELSKTEFEALSRSPYSFERLLQLACIIINAKNSTKNEARRLTITHVLSPSRAEKFKRLRDSRGFTTGQLIDYILDSIP